MPNLVGDYFLSLFIPVQNRFQCTTTGRPRLVLMDKDDVLKGAYE